MTDSTDREGYIPARKRDLAAAIAAQGGLAPADAQGAGETFKLLTAILHHEAHETLETLKALYDPLDPDAPAALRDAGAAAFARFEEALLAALTRANFREIEAQNVQTIAATRALTGLKVKCSQAGIRSIRFFARGERPHDFELKRFMGLRTERIPAQVLNDVVVLVAFKSDEEIGKEDRAAFADMRRGVRPGAALVKHFRNVAHAELVTLHPGAKPRMQTKDSFMLGVPAVAAGVPVLLNLWPALTVLFAVLAGWLGAQGAIEDSDLKRALAAISGLVAVIAFVMRQRLKLEAQTLKYQKRLADTIYFRNIANNSGVLDMLIGAGEEQDAKEAMLAYWALLRAGKPLTREEIDVAAETFLRETMKFDVDFEIHDALAKLERFGVVTHADEAYAAVPPAEALRRLDAAWDDYFKYANAPA